VKFSNILLVLALGLGLVGCSNSDSTSPVQTTAPSGIPSDVAHMIDRQRDHKRTQPTAAPSHDMSHDMPGMTHPSTPSATESDGSYMVPPSGDHHRNMTTFPPMQAKSTAAVSCVPVEKILLATIEAGGIPSAIKFSAAEAYKPAGKGPYFMAGRFTTKTGDVLVGVWALSTLKLKDTPRVLAADATAQAYTFWMEVGKSELRMSSSDPKIARAKKCLG
jgi:hypothetical protein